MMQQNIGQESTQPRKPLRESRRSFLRRGAFLSAAAVLGGRPEGRPRVRAAAAPVPGSRVVQVHDPAATFWEGEGYYGDHVDQDRVDRMLDEGIKALTGEARLPAAWRKILPGYEPGRKIAIKINLNNSHSAHHIDALAQPVNAIVSGLKSLGVQDSDVWVIEPSMPIPPRVGDPILRLHPGVLLWDPFWANSYGHPVTFESGDPALRVEHRHAELTESRLPDLLAGVDYFINLPILKGHHGAGVTLSFKNLFGLVQGISRFHPYTYLSSEDWSEEASPLLDLGAHELLRKRTALIVGDALFGHPTDNMGVPPVWRTFGDAYPGSLFLATDPVAVDSVLFDVLHAEAPKRDEAQRYLHRAMDLDLGVHDHWSSPEEKSYTLIDFVEVDMAQSRSRVDRAIRDFRVGDSDRSGTERAIRELR